MLGKYYIFLPALGLIVGFAMGRLFHPDASKEDGLSDIDGESTEAEAKSWERPDATPPESDSTSPS